AILNFGKFKSLRDPLSDLFPLCIIEVHKIPLERLPTPCTLFSIANSNAKTSTRTEKSPKLLQTKGNCGEDPIEKGPNVKSFNKRVLIHEDNAREMLAVE